jgi:hypothetical protein
MSDPTYPQSFDGIIQVASKIISTVSGVGTSSFTINPRGYPPSFGGIVEVLSDLNLTTSGIEAGGGGGGPLPGASETQSGIIEIATQAEVNAGTDDYRAVTPLKLANSTLASGVVKRYSENIGNATDTSIVVNHNLGTRDVFVTVYRASGVYDAVYTDVNHTDANNVTLVYSVAPSSGEYRVVIST